MRDVLLSATAGFLCSCGGAFAVHRALWKAADAHGQELDALVGNTHGSDVSSTVARRRMESFEGYIGRRMAQWWNYGVDNVYHRLVGLPNTVDRIVEDVKDVRKVEPDNKSK